jgi:hypothetical protein
VAIAASTAATSAATQNSSSYRVKFRRNEFLRLVEIAMYTFDCDDADFSQPVIDAIEFSNYMWSE